MANYHINYLTGSNVTGDGSTENPWATLEYTLDNSGAIAGDVIKVVGSGTTLVDAAASPNTDNLTDDLNTSVDLTSQLAVGDVIRIDPNMSDGPEFNGWMLTEVVAITATTLTTRMEFIFPNQATTNFSIYKIDSPILTSTTENLPGIGPEITVEFGYDATFTSIIGLSYFINNSTGAGGSSGKLFDFNTSGSGTVKTAFMKNLAICRFLKAIEAGFGGFAAVSNLHLLNADSTPSNTGGYTTPDSEDGTGIYLNDCQGLFPMATGYLDYFYYSGVDGYRGRFKAHINQCRDRVLGGTPAGIINGLVGYAVQGEAFGTSQLFQAAYGINISGPVSLIGIDAQVVTTGTFYRTAGIFAGYGEIIMDSFNLVKNGKTREQTPINLITQGYSGKGFPGQAYIKLPTGTTIDDWTWVATGTEPDWQSVSNITLEDDNGIHNSSNCSMFVKQNLIDQETGNSCLELVIPGGRAQYDWTATPILARLATRNGAATLSGIDIRYRNTTTNIKTGNFSLIIGDDPDSAFSTMSFNSTSWATINTTLSTTRNAGRYILQTDQYVPIYIRIGDQSLLSNDDIRTTILIDSITPVYS